MKISVIIPCYNVESYIRECLDSVLTQTLREIEIICVDDGSTDGTFGILKEYEEMSDKICVRKQENQGSGIARNMGIDLATGEYLAFMDADDFYPSQDTLETMYFAAKSKKAEICGGSGCAFRNGVYTYTGFRRGFTFSEDGWIDKKDYPIINGYWRFIYKHELIKRNVIYFPDYIRCQDPPFFLRAIACAGRLFCMREVTYVYRKEHKQVLFTQRKAVDYAKGIRDSLIIAKRECLSAIYSQILNELQGEISALMYLYGEENYEMQGIIHQINGVISDGIADEHRTLLLKEGNEIARYVAEVREEIGLFLEKLSKERKILIFGAGTVGRMVKTFLEERGIGLEAFVVSDMRQNAICLDGLPVHCIEDYVSEGDECMIIIATFPYLHEEISKVLRQKQFKKVYTMSLEKMHLFSGKVVH